MLVILPYFMSFSGKNAKDMYQKHLESLRLNSFHSRVQVSILAVFILTATSLRNVTLQLVYSCGNNINFWVYCSQR